MIGASQFCNFLVRQANPGQFNNLFCDLLIHTKLILPRLPPIYRFCDLLRKSEETTYICEIFQQLSDLRNFLQFFWNSILPISQSGSRRSFR